MGLANDREKTLENIMHIYSDMLLRTAFLILKDRKLAEDAVQEAFISFYYSMNEFRGEASLKTYLSRILVNCCRQKLRKGWFRRDIPVDGNDNPVLFGFHGEDADERLDLSQGLLELDVKYREVLLLYYYNDLSVREIADVLSHSEGTVKSRLKRGREKLKAIIQEDLTDE
jgi:RNA polymerase sigma factor, sigma-70 family